VQIYKNICLVEQKARTFNRIRVKLTIINRLQPKQNKYLLVLVGNLKAL